MAHHPIQVVDENDQPIGKASMKELHKEGLYHRIVRVMVRDNRSRILLQKRSPNMTLSPGLWDHSAAGHVDAGETYEQAAIRETAEEIGVENVHLKEIGSWRSNDVTKDGRILNRFNRAYVTTLNDQIIKPDSHEVWEVKWFALDEVKRLIDEHPETVTEGLRKVIADYYPSN